jgi:RNA polymerase sigma factor (sigma-70 family)
LDPRRGSELVTRAKAGDVEAFAALTRQFQDLALGYAYGLLRDWHLAEDAAQEAFVAAYASLRSLRDDAAFAGWLRRIVHHQCHRTLRRHDIEVTPIQDVEATLASVDGAESRAHRDEQRDLVAAAVNSLPPHLRLVVLLHYLRGASQREVAAFLDLPVSTVNNRLHEARSALKQRMLTMVAGTIKQHALGDEFAKKVGRIVSVRGPVVDVRFDEPAQRADIFDVLAVADASGKRAEKLKVAQRLPDGTVRGVAVAPMEGIAPGAAVANVGGVEEGITPNMASAVVSEDDLRRAVEVLSRPSRRPSPAVLETGIKPIDLFCPLPVDGNVGLFGIQGVGRIVLVEELLHRFGKSDRGAQIFYLVHRNEPESVRGMLWQESGYPGDSVGPMQIVWLLSDLATEPAAATAIDPFDATIYCHPVLGARGLWPAIDPLLSDSTLLKSEIVGVEHVDVASRARELLRRSRQLMTDPLLLELLACRAHAAAKRRAAEFPSQRMSELSETDRQLVARARKLEHFLTNRFFVAEPFTKQPGVRVPLSETIRGCGMILDGAADALQESALLYVGAFSDAC